MGRMAHVLGRTACRYCDMDLDATPPERSDAARRSRRRRRERGASLVEYALIVALFAVGSIAAIDLLADNAATTTQNTADEISSGPRS